MRKSPFIIHKAENMFLRAAGTSLGIESEKFTSCAYPVSFCAGLKGGILKNLTVALTAGSSVISFPARRMKESDASS